MSKALTPVNPNDERADKSTAHGLTGWARNSHFPSYFGNFNPFLMLGVEARFSKRCPGKKHEFPLITAFMAIM
jgi:hypothetical protein